MLVVKKTVDKICRISYNESTKISEGEYSIMANVSSKSRLVATILAAVGGYFGLDLFYKGKIFWGIVAIPAMFVLVGEIWWIIRLIMTVCGVSTDRHGNRIKVWIHK